MTTVAGETIRGAPGVRAEIDHQAILQELQERQRMRRARGRGWLMRRMLLGADVVGLMGAIVLTEIAFGSTGTPDAFPVSQEIAWFAATLPAWLVAARLFGLYDRDEERADHSTAEDLARVLLLMTVGVFAVTRLAALTGVADPDEAKVTGLWALGIACVTGARIVARAAGRRSSKYLQDTVIVGAGDVGQLVARKIISHPEFGLRLLGFVDANPRERLSHLGHLRVIGDLDDLDALVDTLGIDRVVFAFSSDSHEHLLPLVRRLRDAGVQVDMVPRLFEVIGPKIDVHSLEGLSLVGLPPVKPRRSTRAVKRAIDVVGASAALVVTAPLFAVIALFVRLDSAGPVLFRQARLGQGMQAFDVLKFRTMTVDTDPEAHREYVASIMDVKAVPSEGGLFKAPQASSVTRVGAILRRWSLDELPQLINVLCGQMSLVGPRPCMQYEVAQFEPHHFERFLVPAGVTGLWQVSARARSTFVEALDMDVLYAQSHSVALDLRLLLRTPIQLLRPSSTA